MNFDFEAYVFEKLSAIAVELRFEDLKIYVSEEQTFAKIDTLEPESIYVVIKYLSSDIQYYTETMPIQLLVLSEQNSLEKAKMIMNKFANDNNWHVEIDGGTYIKQQYNSPVVLSNYVEVGFGYRSTLYITGTLYIMENIIDVTDIKIDSVAIKPLNCNISYSMSTNTQQLPNIEIASSEKTVSTFAMTLTIPMRELKSEPGLIRKVMSIIAEQISGNIKFKISFKCDVYETVQDVETEVPVEKDMKLISAQIITAPNAVPSMQLGFMK